jgi:hypothetical protein
MLQERPFGFAHDRLQPKTARGNLQLFAAEAAPTAIHNAGKNVRDPGIV